MTRWIIYNYKKHFKGKCLDLGSKDTNFALMPEGSIGINLDNMYPHVMVHDLNTNKLPFGSKTFDFILFSHTIEHLDDVTLALGEFHRILKKGGRVIIKEFPYVSGISRYEDITHKHCCSWKTFHKFVLGDKMSGYNTQYYTGGFAFNKIKQKIVFGRMLFWNVIIEPLVNTFPILYENLPLMKAMFPAIQMDVEFIK